MKYSFAGKENEPDIKQLLADCDLLHEDITPAMLEHFLLGWDSARLVAVVGHYDCAGAPGSKVEHLAYITLGVKQVKSWKLGVTAIGLWVDSKWKVEEVS